VLFESGPESVVGVEELGGIVDEKEVDVDKEVEEVSFDTRGTTSETISGSLIGKEYKGN